MVEALSMLHEAMDCAARHYEDIEQASDAVVARGVAALTPDRREPVARRTRLWANGVVLADLTKTWRQDPW